MKDQHNKQWNIAFLTIIGILIIVIFVMYFFAVSLFNEGLYDKLLWEFLIRITVSLIFMYFLIRYGYKEMFACKISRSTLVFIIPAVLVAVNNFPISAFVSGRYSIVESKLMFLMFGLDSLGVGVFEEIIFRGVVLLVLLQYFPKTKQGNFLAIVVSGLIFGISHFVNLGYGSAIDGVLLQVGYSFLMGMMWAVIYIKTRNIWIVALLHALYNYCGMILYQTGTVTNRFDLVTILVTILFAGIAIVYYWLSYQKMEVVEE